MHGRVLCMNFPCRQRQHSPNSPPHRPLPAIPNQHSGSGLGGGAGYWRGKRHGQRPSASCQRPGLEPDSCRARVHLRHRWQPCLLLGESAPVGGRPVHGRRAEPGAEALCMASSAARLAHANVCLPAKRSSSRHLMHACVGLKSSQASTEHATQTSPAADAAMPWGLLRAPSRSPVVHAPGTRHGWAARQQQERECQPANRGRGESRVHAGRSVSGHASLPAHVHTALKCTGAARNARCPLPTYLDVRVPELKPLPCSVCSGKSHACGLGTDSQAYCWVSRG